MKKIILILMSAIAFVCSSCNHTGVTGGDNSSGWRLLSEVSAGTDVVSGVLEYSGNKKCGRRLVSKPSYVLQIDGGDQSFEPADLEILYSDSDSENIWWKKMFEDKNEWSKRDRCRFEEKVYANISNAKTLLGIQSTWEYNRWAVAQNGEYLVRICARIYLKNKSLPEYIVSDSTFRVRLRSGKVSAIFNSK